MLGAEMSDLGDGERQAPSASSEAVLAELKMLRQREGISPRRIKEEAPELSSLPLVEDQMRYRGFSPMDRHLGAYTAVGCVIDHDVRDLLHRQILRITLRYQTQDRVDTLFNEAALVAENKHLGSLDARDRFARSSLFLSKNSYESHRVDAYQDLADGLVLNEVSPCRGSASSQVGDLAKEVLLETILGLFSLEVRQGLRTKLAQEVLDRVPLLGASDQLDPVERLELGLLSLETKYARALSANLRGSVDHAIPPYLSGTRLISVLMLEDVWLAERLVRANKRFAPSRDDAQFFKLWFEEFVLPSFVRSVRLLCRVMVGEEQGHAEPTWEPTAPDHARPPKPIATPEEDD